MEKSCSIHRDTSIIQNTLVGKPNGVDHFGDLNVKFWVVAKLTVNTLCTMVTDGSGQGTVVPSCKQSNIIWNFIER
jgi:hypothetical protein